MVSRACDAVGVERSTAYRAAEADPSFREAWDSAMEVGIDRAEAEAFRRAVEGTEKGVWHQGVLVGSERVYSDALMSLVLKGRRKKIYADRTEITGADGGPVVQVDETTRSARVAQLLALAERRKQAQQDFGDLA